MAPTKTSHSILSIKGILFVIVVIASILRLFHLSQVPVSLFGDELDVGYHAYSILKTGRDYSGNFMPLHLQSLAEWRTPLYLYSAVPTVALFGISPLGVRLPAALFGIATIPMFYLLVSELIGGENESRKRKLGLFAAFLLAVSPWHIQYSRAAFEVTQLLFFLISGIYLFIRSLRTKGSLLWLSGISFGLMPWVYSTAKMFTPFLFVILGLVYLKEIFALPKKTLLVGLLAAGLVLTPITWSTLFGGGTQRFNYISIFSDPTVEPEIGTARGNDAHNRGETGTGLNPTPIDKMFHNKFTYWGESLLQHSFMPFSTEFLFLTGDPNPRHSIEGMGEFYKFEIIGLLAGLAFFIAKSENRKSKILIALWIILGVFPSSLTRDGGNHATRLILILPPLVFLVAYGFMYLLNNVNSLFKRPLVLLYVVVFVLSFVSYQHLYWVHNPSQSERWWHYGWGPAITEVKRIQSQYDNVVITSADEPPWIFFAGWYEYDPVLWHQGYPMKKHQLTGFGEVSYIGKFSFGSFEGKKGLYDWGKILDSKTLYLASAKEVNVNLIAEPERTPKDIQLLKSFAYPSGEPAFYLFTGISR